MSSHNTMIMLIVTLAITTAGVVIFSEAQSQLLTKPSQQSDGISDSLQNDIVVTNIIGHNVTDNTVDSVRIQVKYEGDGDIPLNETLIQLQTDTSTVDLRYRNGTLYKDSDSGYFTR